MKGKTFLQKAALVTVILLALHVVPGIALLASLFEVEQTWPMLNPYLFGWFFNAGLAVMIFIMVIAFKLGEYSKTGKWNRKFLCDL